MFIVRREKSVISLHNLKTVQVFNSFLVTLKSVLNISDKQSNIKEIEASPNTIKCLLCVITRIQ